MLVVYLISNKINDKCYIGITNNFKRRMIEHKCFKDKSSIISKSINKYGKDSFNYEIIDYAKDMDDLNNKEMMYIKFYKELGVELYNLTDGGGNYIPRRNYIPSEETRKKQSESHKGKVHSDEAKKKMSESHKGRIVTEDTKNILREKNKGKKHSEETKKKVSLASKGRKHSEETKEKMSKSQKGRVFSEDHKKNLSDASKKYWNERNNKIEECNIKNQDIEKEVI
jgi:group I intron endonuclease